MPDQTLLPSVEVACRFVTLTCCFASELIYPNILIYFYNEADEAVRNFAASVLRNADYRLEKLHF
jgi:hypothetical protein